MPLKSNHLETKHYKPFGIERMEGKNWQYVMDKGLNIMNSEEFECQLGSGTLLGMIREDDHYIHHDTDIDIDVIVRENTGKKFNIKIMNIIDEFEKAGFDLIRTQFYQDLPMQIAFIYKTNNLIFDLCFFYKKWGSDFCNIYEHGVFIRPDYSVDVTSEYSFNSSSYTIPMDWDKYLIGRYGKDWETPKTGKESGEKDASNYLIVL